MPSDDRSERLAAELEVMQGLARQSSILEFETKGDPPEEYKVTLRGKGLSRTSTYGGDVQCVDVHEFEIRLGYTFPQRPPEVRWLTPIFHPNVSTIGYVRLAECGLQWVEKMTLDVVCERLWDLARGAYVNVERSMNYSAKKWYSQECDIALPVDHRPLRDRGGPPPGNVIRYRRGPAGKEAAPGEILYIGDDTATPPPPPPPPETPRRRRKDDEEILYIGDE
jgi:ubiquitin-protein ligase